jgi:hypothetical protein
LFRSRQLYPCIRSALFTKLIFVLVARADHVNERKPPSAFISTVLRLGATYAASSLVHLRVDAQIYRLLTSIAMRTIPLLGRGPVPLVLAALRPTFGIA